MDRGSKSCRSGPDEQYRTTVELERSISGAVPLNLLLAKCV